MNLNDFIQKYTGKKLDYDGAYANQCVDLYRFYVKEVWQKPQTPGVIGAYQIMNTLPAGYDKFTKGVPLPGDVIVWNENQVKNGHVAVVVTANPTSFTAFQQNAPRPGDACNIATFTYKNIIGWFRPTPKPMPTKFKQKILVLVSKIDADDLLGNKEGIQNYIEKVARRTNGDFTLEVDYYETDAVFSTIKGTGLSGSTTSPVEIPIVYVDPAGIAHVGRLAEQSLNKQYDVIALLYDPRFIVGDQPTNPVHNPLYVEGFTTFQIPSSWVGNDLWASELFFAHEHCHTHPTIIKTESGVYVVDKTHGDNPYNSYPIGGVITQTDFFADNLIELKSFWKYLADVSATTQGIMPMLIAHKKSNVNEKWLIEGGRRRGYADAPAYNKDIAGQTVCEIALDDAELLKIPEGQVIKS